MLKNQTARSVTSVFVWTTAANVLLFASMAVAARMLSTEQFGLFASLFGLVALAGVILGGVQTAVATAVAEADESVRQHALGVGFRAVSMITIACTALLLAVSPVVGAFLHIEGWAAPAAAAIAASSLIPWSAMLGAYQGSGRFGTFGQLSFFQAALRLVLLASLLLWSTAGVALLAVALSTLPPLFIGVATYSRHSKAKSVTGTQAIVWLRARMSHSVGAVLLASTIGFPDVVLVRHVYSSHAAGQYASVALLGKILIFLPIATNAVFYPKFVAERAQRGLKTLAQAFAAALVLTSLAGAAFALFPKLALRVVAGPEFGELSNLVWIYAAYSMAFALASVLAFFLLARGHAKVLGVLLALAIAAQTAVPFAIGNNLRQLMLANLVVGAVLMVACAAMVSINLNSSAIADSIRKTSTVSARSKFIEFAQKPAVLVGLALLMLVTVVIPAQVWKAPASDGMYSGFDPITMYSNSTGDGTAPGVIDMQPQTVNITASPQSEPVVHLATGPLSYTSQFDFTVTDASPGTAPFVLSVWAPYTERRFQLVFESEPTRRVLLRRTEQGKVLSEEPLGIYNLGQKYHAAVELDRNKKTASIKLTTDQNESVSGQAVYLPVTSQPFESHLLGPVVAVSAGQEYAFRSNVKDLSQGLGGLSIEWLDNTGARISIDSSWQPSRPQDGWRGREIVASAPANAASARVELATADGSQTLFANPALESTSNAGVNLLSNFPLESQSTSWRRSEGAAPLEYREFPNFDVSAAINGDQWPELFSPTRMALSIESKSVTGFTQVTVTDYKLDLIHQRWIAVKVNDMRLKSAVAVFGLLGLAALAAVAFADGEIIRKIKSRFAGDRAEVSATFKLKYVAVFVAGAVVYLIGNALLSGKSSLNNDLIGARIWGHAASKNGLGDVYFSPNVSSSEAVQWQGIPLQEGGFPYGGVMAYITKAQSWIYDMFFKQSATADTGLGLDSLAKFTNGLFAIGCAVIIYLIVREHRKTKRFSAVIAAVFLFNPATWFAGSVWGSSQSCSLLFLLTAVLMTKRKSLAWAFLFFALMTRPQNLFPGVLLAAYLLWSSDFRRNATAMAKAFIGTYVVMLPLSLAISPTLPVDNWYNALFLHVGKGNDEWTKPLSWGGMSIWPLIVSLFHKVSGVDRILFPSSTEMIAGKSYDDIGTLLMFGTIGLLGLMVLFRARNTQRPISIRVVMAAGAMALMTLNTGTPSYHYVLALALIIVAAGDLPKRVFWASVGTVSLTTFYGMYGMGAYWLTPHPEWSVGVYNGSNPIAQFMAWSVQQDAIVTVACLANVAVLAALLWYAFVPYRTPEESEANVSIEDRLNELDVRETRDVRDISEARGRELAEISLDEVLADETIGSGQPE